MKSQARVVVIGGGVGGCSTLYHLTKLGWSDVVLVEKDELTSGSTWLAAGNTPQYCYGFNMSKIHNYAVQFYPTLEEETDQATGWHRPGSLRIATKEERMLEFVHTAEKDKITGVNSRMCTVDECLEIYPYMNPEGVLGGLFHPEDGHVDPAGVTQAMAKGARMRGAEVYRFNPVEAITRTPAGEWIVHTKKGDITCEYVVNCAGLWAPAIGAMVGLDLPIMAMEHQHILFGDVPELVETGRELPLLREPDASWYMRQEMHGLLIGPYELGPKIWHPEGVPQDYHSQSLPTDLDRIQDILVAAIARVPILQNVGVKHEVNGPITYTPDGETLVGPAFGVPNFFINAGNCFGITQCAAFGLHTAEWIIEGQPSIDLSMVDPRRYGSFANKDYTAKKIYQAYEMMHFIPFPAEERPAARKVKTGPIYDLLEKQGACFGQMYGWERANWFAPEGVEPVDDLTFRRPRWQRHVGLECQAVRERVGLLDLSAFSKYEVSGPGAEAFLNYLCANSLPPRPGRIKVSHMLTHKGGVKCDLTITRLARDRFYIVAAAAANRHDLDWMLKHRPNDGSVSIENVTYRYGAFVLSGPRSRDLLAKVTDDDISNQGFRFLDCKDILVNGCPARALRISFLGELGWELHHPVEYSRNIYQALMEAGEEFGIANFGIRALNSLRLEKGYCLLGSELSIERTPLEGGMERLVDFDKGGFMGRQALLDQQEAGLPSRLVLMSVDADGADAIGNEPVFKGDRLVGRTTSGGYGHALELSLAMAYLAPEAAAEGTEVEISIFGDRRKARVVQMPLYDPKSEKLRS